MSELPQAADTVIIGGGTTGAALAGLLAERADGSILVLEAGPDFGPLSAGGWPADVLDATWLATSHQLGYASDDGYRGRRIEFPRAAMIGGCSSHNGCAAIWGSALDYDTLAAEGCEGWSRADVEPLLRAASDRMRVRIPAEDELPPFQRAALASLVALGVPRVGDLNDLDADTGVAPSPANIADGVRWNSALAYLDPVREHRSLQICGQAPVERLLVEAGRVRGVVVRRGRERPRDPGRAGDRLRRRLRLPRAPAALGDRACRAICVRSGSVSSQICRASARICTTTPRSSSRTPARRSCARPAARMRRAGRSHRSRA